MGPPSYMWTVAERIVIRRTTVLLGHASFTTVERNELQVGNLINPLAPELFFKF